ncbi:hypothetical protein K4L04_01200 [Phaeobacter inhibens]|uniref:PDC sensor domain-containing protein n=1 Tax=Phaeobacter inhibens TaxID=221822 RepID=UPI0021A5546E|nr:hypothetical protein [Phaeobacter inhibens]UWR76607.1 hypothetical protein K4L04_01200 [Phaeobacter inhibens]
MSVARILVDFALRKNAGDRLVKDIVRRIAAVALLAALLPWSGGVNAQDTSEFQLIFELGTSRFALAEHVLRSSADYVAENPEAGAGQGHVALKGILNSSQHFRSILALSESGVLKYDSFNLVPYEGAADLGDRSYFKDATNAKAKVMIIGSPVIGRQSGQSFIPLSMAVPVGRAKKQPVVVLTVPPEALLPKAHMCPFCGVSIVSDGEVIASNRPLSEINKTVLRGMPYEGLYGAREIKVRGMSVAVHWRRSKEYNIVFVYFEAEGGSE